MDKIFRMTSLPHLSNFDGKCRSIVRIAVVNGARGGLAIRYFQQQSISTETSAPSLQKQLADGRRSDKALMHNTTASCFLVGKVRMRLP